MNHKITIFNFKLLKLKFQFQIDKVTIKLNETYQHNHIESILEN